MALKLLSDAKRAVLLKMLIPADAEETAILEENQIRRLHMTHRKRISMGLELNIPVRHHIAIRSMIPELTDGFTDRETRRKYWLAFMGDELARPYKVQ